MNDAFLFYFAKYKNNLIKPSQVVKDEKQSTKTNNFLIRDLYIEFVNEYLLDKVYIKEIIDILRPLKINCLINAECGGITESEQRKAQIELEKIVYKHIKVSYNSSLLGILTKSKLDYTVVEEVFIDRFNDFKAIFFRQIEKTEKLKFNFNLISLLLQDKDKDVLFYMFINIFFTELYNNTRFKSKQIMSQFDPDK